MICVNCKIETGTHVLCKDCRKLWRGFSKDKKRKIMIVWHDTVCKKDYVESENGYKCTHPDCRGKIYSREKVCGDHILTKGSHPELRFDTENGRTRCKPHNDSQLRN